MKVSDIFKILEQDDPWGDVEDPNDDNNNNDNDDDNNDNDASDVEFDDEDLNTPEPTPTPEKKKKLKPIQIAKLKWKEERNGLNDNEINQIIEEFNRRKNNFRAFQGTINEPDPQNMPEITSFKQAFPNFPAENIQKLKDVTQYTFAQLEFLIDRLTNREAVTELEFEIQGDTIEDRWNNALKIWKNFIPRQQIYKDENFIVNKVEGKDEANALGNLQHILVGKHGGNKWCITRHPGGGDGSNLYNSYRDNVSYYFVLDLTKSEDDHYFTSVLQPKKYGELFDITTRPNKPEDTFSFSWEGIVEIYPKLESLKNKIVYFGTTDKEDLGASLDNISMHQGDPHDLAIKSHYIQQLYIESNRMINSARVFLSLTKDLQKLYIDLTKLEDYKQRYKNNDPSKPFAMLESLGKKNIKYLHEHVLQRRLGIVDGIYGIKASIIKLQYAVSFIVEDNPNLRIFHNKTGNEKLYGILDLSTLKWKHNLTYRKSKPKMIMVNSKISLVFKYENNENDYFYFAIDRKNLTKQQDDPKKYVGTYFSKEEGDNKFGNKFRV